MTNDLTSNMVKEYGLNAGACVVGIASTEDFGCAPEGHRPSDILEGCLSVIVLGSPLPREVLDNTLEYTENRNAMVKGMTNTAMEVAKKIKAVGYQAKPISATGGTFENGEHFGHISLKHAAELAGLGCINKNYLLTNIHYGNLLWLSAVLTEAALTPDKKAQYRVCDHCNQCVEACPSGALANPSAFGKKGCARFFTLTNKKLEIKCYRCRTICPYCYGKHNAD